MSQDRTAPSSSSAPAVEIGSKSKALGYYNPDPLSLSAIPPDTVSLLRDYSHLPEQQILSHIINTRTKLWEIFHWPCIGQFRFLDLSLHKQPAYESILARLVTANDRILDVGCCLAQDLRKLAHDGAPASALHGIDLEERFLDMSYDFFRDRDNPAFSGATLMHGDFLTYGEQGNVEALNREEGTFGVVHIGMVLHIFDWEGQVRACERLVRFLRDEPGVMIVGQSVGDLEGKEVFIPGRDKSIFKHNVETFRRMWDEVGERTGTEWRVRAQLDQGLGIAEGKRDWDEPTARRLAFNVEKV